MRFTLGKQEKLKSKKAIEILFEKGSRIKSYPLQLMYIKNIEEREILIKVGFSVPKRTIKKAVKRNEIKRVMREAYRIQKSKFTENLKMPYDLMFIYSAKEKADHKTLEKNIEKLCQIFLTKIAEDET